MSVLRGLTTLEEEDNIISCSEGSQSLSDARSHTRKNELSYFKFKLLQTLSFQFFSFFMPFLMSEKMYGIILLGF